MSNLHLRQLPVIALGVTALALTGCGGSETTASSTETAASTSSVVSTADSSSTPDSMASSMPAASDTPTADQSSDAATQQASTSASPAASGSAGSNVWATTPATATTIKGTGYTYQVPAGWRDTKQMLKSQGVNADTGAANGKDTDGFADNINVLSTGVGNLVGKPGAQEQVMAQLKEQGATKLKALPATTLDGKKVIRYSATMPVDKRTNDVEQWLVSTAGDTFVITFSGGQGVTEAQRAKVFGPIVSSWKWTA